MGVQRTDVVIVGAGVIGLACGWRLAARGLSVVVLERDDPGAGASGVAAGMLAPVTEADFGEESLLRLNLEGRELWPAFAAELGEVTALPTGFAETGALVVAADRDDAEELRRLYAFQDSLGLQADWLAPRAARQLEPGLSPRIRGAILAPQDGCVRPEDVVKALARAFTDAGGVLRNEAEVTGLLTEGGRVSGVEVSGVEIIEADTVVVAAGAWSAVGDLATEASAPEIRPVKGQLLELRVRPTHRAPARRVIRTPRCYIVNRGGGSIVIGATQEEQGFDTTVTADAVYRLLEAAYEVLPDVGELELTAARAGLRPSTPDNAPAIGAGVEGLVWATGHHRNGMLLAPLTARAVTSLIADGELPESVLPFDPGRFAHRIAQ
jgi:glycine oxidase